MTHTPRQHAGPAVDYQPQDHGPAAIVSLHTQHWQAWPILAGVVMLWTLVFVASGCRKGPSESTVEEQPAGPPPQLKIVVVDDPHLAGRIRQQWQAHERGPLVIEELKSEDVASSRRISADAIVFPSQLLGTLAARNLLAAWPKSANGGLGPASDGDIFALQRFRETMWGPQTYAAPFGSPQFLLYIRKDRLAAVRRDVPGTWSEYGALLQQLSLKEESSTAYAVAEPLGPGWAGKVLLARAAPYIQHRSQFSDLFDYASMEPMIASEPFVRALRELVATAKLAPPEVLEATPVDVKRWFYAGRVAIAWSWPSSQFDISDEVDDPIETANVELAELPGATESYLYERSIWEAKPSTESRQVALLGIAGRLGSVLRGSSHRQAAAEALQWLTSREFGGTISAASAATTAFRSSHAGDPMWLDVGLPQTLSGEHARLLETTQNHARAVTVPRIPGVQRYLAALDEAVHKAVKGADPAECLAEAAKEWEAITNELGRDAQHDAYRRSLGLEP